jgi:hypothetical protein
MHDLEVVPIEERDRSVAKWRQSYDIVRFAEKSAHPRGDMSPRYRAGPLTVRSDTAPARGLLCADTVAKVHWGEERLIFWFCSNVISPHNAISPHKQGSFDFSRARLAFFRDLPD